jgi:uncharacterized membrane protein
MDYKKLGLALVFTVVAIFNFLKNPLFIIGSWGTLLLSLAAIFAYLRAFKVEPSAKVLKQVWKGEFDFKRTFWVFYVLIGTILTIPLYLDRNLLRQHRRDISFILASLYSCFLCLYYFCDSWFLEGFFKIYSIKEKKERLSFLGLCS